ncbi:MAG: glycoside hydrolase family 127 protein [Bryobacteraceae bacterium]|nr:glycoside hydrolase family 127 protein [Bryobacteraceae bacterium]
MRLETRYPEAEDVKLTAVAARPESLALRLRIPGWLRRSAVVKLNGQPLEGTPSAGSYLELTRVWRAGDMLEARFPMDLSAEVMPDDPKVQAYLYGPLVLAGDLGAEGLTEAHIIGPNFRVGAPGVEQHGSPLAPTNQVPPVPDLEIPILRPRGADPASWIKPADSPLTFRTTGQQRDVTLVPLYRLFDRRYAVYWEVA